MIASTGSRRFLDELVGLDGLPGDGMDRVLGDLAFSLRHGRMLARTSEATGSKNWQQAGSSCRRRRCRKNHPVRWCERGESNPHALSGTGS
jgi:hypothetical protein